MPAEKPFNKFSLPGRLKPLDERRPVTSQDRINQFALPSWENIEGLFELRMYNEDNLYTLSLKHRSVLRRFYDARYAIATGQGWELYNQFNNRYSESKRLMTELTPHFGLIRDAISPPRPKK